jgi:hypothetical protein
MSAKSLSGEKIREIYTLVATYHQQYLVASGVKLPQLEKRGRFTKDALVLVYLAQGYPDTQWVTKEELTHFVRQHYPDTNDVQSARHLGMQSGFYIVLLCCEEGFRTQRGGRAGACISSTKSAHEQVPEDRRASSQQSNIVSSRRGNYLPEDKPPPNSSAYLLVSLKLPHPAFVPNRRSSADTEFETVKQRYGYRCATCGSKEGEANLRYKNQRTQLQQGHRNPKLPLEGENIIPQCQFCNRADRNWWVYDERGRVVGVGAVKPIQRSIEKGYLSEQEVQSLYEYLSRRLRRRRRRDG